MPANSSEVVFKDFNITFAGHPVTGALATLKNNEAVTRAVRSLILTNRYERRYQPNVGGNVVRHLFENFSPFTIHSLKKSIETTLSNYEPRVSLIDIRTNVVEDNNRLDITIIYRIVNQAQPVESTIIIERVR